MSSPVPCSLRAINIGRLEQLPTLALHCTLAFIGDPRPRTRSRDFTAPSRSNIHQESRRTSRYTTRTRGPRDTVYILKGAHIATRLLLPTTMRIRPSA
jgi:hypothetical protein